MTKIVTSIAPKNFEIQHKAVDSWLSLGLDVVSINHRSEIDELKQEFNDVFFEETLQTAKVLYGREKHYPSIKDMLNLGFSQDDPFWIINSDIILRAEKNIIEEIEEIAKSTLVFGSRVDLEKVDSKDGHFYEGGFDYFVLSSEIHHIFLMNSTKMCMGQPWWDFWLPIMCIRKGITPVRCNKKIAYHIEHDGQWDIDQLFFFGKILAKEIGLKEFNRPDMELLGKSCLETIRKQSEGWE